MKPIKKIEDQEIYLGGKSRSDISIEGKVYKMSSNENPLGPSPLALAAIKGILPDINEYPDRTDKKLKAALIEVHKGILSADEIITGNGGTALIQLIAQVFLGPETECIYSDPSFSPYSIFSKKTGAKVINVPLLQPDYRLDKEGILEAVNSKTRIIWLCSPNNPTGSYISREDMIWILDRLPGHVIPVYDEVYHHFTDKDDYTTGLTFVKNDKSVLAINSFSKAYGLAGLRIGYAYGPSSIISQLQRFIRPFHVNMLSLCAAEAALLDTGFITRTVQLIHHERQYLYEQLNELGIQYWPSEANFILMRPPMGSGEFESLMLENRIMVRPADKFGVLGGVRLTIGKPEANQAFIHALKEILKSLKIGKV